MIRRIAIRSLAQLANQVREWRQAKRDYRALCDQGRAAQLQIDIRIHPDDYEWTGLDGITGIKTTIPLTRAGKRYVRRVINDIEASCVRAVRETTRQAREEETQP
jgi:hypothetical protein